MAGAAGGLVGALFYAAFGPFKCKQCGPIARSEFPKDIQSKMTLGSLLLVVTAVVLFVLVIALLIFIKK